MYSRPFCRGLYLVALTEIQYSAGAANGLGNATCVSLMKSPSRMVTGDAVCGEPPTKAVVSLIFCYRNVNGNDSSWQAFAINLCRNEV